MELLRKNGFVLALLGAVALAYLNPSIGKPDGALKADALVHFGVMLIFFIQGLVLKSRDLARGVAQIRPNAFVQVWIFLLSGAILVTASIVMRAAAGDSLANGFLYLALIPTTISSAVAFTSAAGGNVPGAVFNTTLSNLLAVFWVPTGCFLLFAAQGQMELNLLLPLLGKIAKLILAPLLAGQLVRLLAGESALLRRIAPAFKYINSSIILFIVYSAFCQSFLSDAWGGVGRDSLVLLLVMTTASVLLVHAGVWRSSRWLPSREDRIMALFCGGQKTLAAGAPMAAAIFAGNTAVAEVNPGLLLLPLLCYHPIQLLLGAALIPRLKA